MKLREEIHRKILENSNAVEDFFKSRANSDQYPFYSSFDIRESENKLAPVDANLFPAGFNNICNADHEVMDQLLARCLEFRNLKMKTMGIFCEEHTNNPYYWDNINSLKKLFETVGIEVFLLLPNFREDFTSTVTASGVTLNFSNPDLDAGGVEVEGAKLDFILSNNDFSTAHDSWISQVEVPVLPPLFMGWHRRRKCSFFVHYNELITAFANIIGIDSSHLVIGTESFDEFVIDDKESLEALSRHADQFVSDLSKRYKDVGISDDPYIYVKNSYGTYGLGVIEVKDPQDILKWNYKSRKKMKATKGGKGFSSVILQEGIPTALNVNGSPAEAVIYLLGCSLAGGFLRTNERKSNQDSLNSPGAVFQRLCFADFEFDKEGNVFENVYGTLARVGALALGREMDEAKEG